MMYPATIRLPHLHLQRRAHFVAEGFWYQIDDGSYLVVTLTGNQAVRLFAPRDVEDMIDYLYRLEQS